MNDTNDQQINNNYVFMDIMNDSAEVNEKIDTMRHNQQQDKTCINAIKERVVKKDLPTSKVYMIILVSVLTCLLVYVAIYLFKSNCGKVTRVYGKIKQKKRNAGYVDSDSESESMSTSCSECSNDVDKVQTAPKVTASKTVTSKIVTPKTVTPIKIASIRNTPITTTPDKNKSKNSIDSILTNINKIKISRLQKIDNDILIENGIRRTNNEVNIEEVVSNGGSNTVVEGDKNDVDGMDNGGGKNDGDGKNDVDDKNDVDGVEGDRKDGSSESSEISLIL